MDNRDVLKRINEILQSSQNEERVYFIRKELLRVIEEQFANNAILQNVCYLLFNNAEYDMNIIQLSLSRIINNFLFSEVTHLDGTKEKTTDVNDFLRWIGTPYKKMILSFKEDDVVVTIFFGETYVEKVEQKHRDGTITIINYEHYQKDGIDVTVGQIYADDFNAQMFFENNVFSKISVSVIDPKIEIELLRDGPALYFSFYDTKDDFSIRFKISHFFDLFETILGLDSPVSHYFVLAILLFGPILDELGIILGVDSLFPILDELFAILESDSNEPGTIQLQTDLSDLDLGYLFDVGKCRGVDISVVFVEDDIFDLAEWPVETLAYVRLIGDFSVDDIQNLDRRYLEKHDLRSSCNLVFVNNDLFA